MQVMGKLKLKICLFYVHLSIKREKYLKSKILNYFHTLFLYKLIYLGMNSL